MIHASCLCGQVRLAIDEPLEHPPEACHCRQCRKSTGHFFVGINVRRSRLHLEGEAAVAWYRSSEKVERGFCRHCGTTLFWKPVIEGYAWTSVALGCLDTPLGVPIAKHTFVAEKGGYYEIPGGAVRSEGF